MRRLPLHAVRVHGLGGECAYSGGDQQDREIIAWGGVLAQFFVLLVPTVALQFFWLEPSGIRLPRWALELSVVFVRINIFLIIINLIPVTPRTTAVMLGAFLVGSSVNEKGKYNAPAAQRSAKKARPAHLRVVTDESVSKEAERIAREALENAKFDKDRPN